VERLKTLVISEGVHAVNELYDVAKERDEWKAKAENLAHDALAILSANGVATPEKGYIEEPYMLPLDIKSLARERDAALDKAIDANNEALKWKARAEKLYEHVVCGDSQPHPQNKLFGFVDCGKCEACLVKADYRASLGEDA
jgi:hypothetical protein